MVTCYVRYELNMEALEAFAEYGRLWMRIINGIGGVHHGYFLPNTDPQAQDHGRLSFPIGTEGPGNIGVALYSFPSWEIYEKYRREAGDWDECRQATGLVEETQCFYRYERSFLTPVKKGGRPRPSPVRT